MSRAAISHVVSRNPISEVFSPLLLLILTVVLVFQTCESKVRFNGGGVRGIIMNESVKKQIQDAVSEGKTIHGNRRAHEKIRNWGIEVSDGSEIVPWEEFVEKLLSEDQKAKALLRARQLPELPDIPLPSVVGIYREIIRVITLGANGAAITLSSILVEYMLKFATYKLEVGAFQKHDASKWEEFEKTTFHPAIERAAKNGLLSDERKKSLINFKTKIRNPYLHYNIKKITEGIVLKNVTEINLNTGETEVVDLYADSDPTIQPDAKRFVDETNVLEIFTYANDFVKEMWAKISHLE